MRIIRTSDLYSPQSYRLIGRLLLYGLEISLVMSMTLSIALEPAPIETDDYGVVRVSRTRVTLDTVVTAFLEGCTPEEIGEQYPSLQLSDIYLVIGYYLRHRDEVHTYLAERQHQADMIQQEVEQRFNPIGIRDRLLARRDQSR